MKFDSSLFGALFLAGCLGIMSGFACFASLGDFAALVGVGVASVMAYLGYKPVETVRAFKQAMSAVARTMPLKMSAMMDVWKKPHPGVFFFSYMIIVVGFLTVDLIDCGSGSTILRHDKQLALMQVLTIGCIVCVLSLFPLFFGLLWFDILPIPEIPERLTTRSVRRTIQEHEALKCLISGNELELPNLFFKIFIRVPYAVWISVFLHTCVISVVGWIAFMIIMPLWILSKVGSIILLTFRFIHSKDVRFVCSVDGGTGTLLTWGLARLSYGADFGSLPVATQLMIALAGGFLCVGFGLASVWLIKWLEPHNNTITT